MKPAFCFICGCSLVMGYPCNDPENGPARMQCPKGHTTVADYAHNVLGADIVWDALHDFASSGCVPEFPNPPHVQEAARVVIDYVKAETAAAEARAKEYAHEHGTPEYRTPVGRPCRAHGTYPADDEPCWQCENVEDNGR